MMKRNFPVGNIIEFIGDPTVIAPSADSMYYWIGKSIVSTKKDLDKPYIQIHYNKTGKSGDERTVAPNGKWEMKINSPEYYNALDDYNFHVIDGRFAMKPIEFSYEFFSNNEFDKIKTKFIVKDFMELDPETYFVEYQDPKLQKKEWKVSLGIASAVTSYGRVEMSTYKKDKNLNLLYTDTDSVFLTEELPEDKVSSTEIGKMKLENVYSDGVFLGPKIYSTISKNGEYFNKIRGFSEGKKIPFKDLVALLSKDATLKLSHKKWFRNILEGNILIEEQPYILQTTSLKRDIIYNEKGLAINTKAFKI